MHLHIRSFFFRLMLPLYFLTLGCSDPTWQAVDISKRQGNLAAAVAEIEAHLQSSPNDQKALYQLGEIRGQQTRWQDMLAAFQRCDSLGSRYSPQIKAAIGYYWTTRMNSGIAALRGNDYPAAIESFQHATAIDRLRPEGYRQLGDAFYAQKDLPHATTSFEAALNLLEGDGRLPLHQRLMRVLFQTEQFEAALSHTRALLDKDGKDAEALRFRAYSYDRQGLVEQAGLAYKDLLKQSALAVDYETYAAFLFQSGDYDAAVAASREAIVHSGDRLQNLRSIAQVLFIAQNYRSLFEVTAEIIEFYPGDLAALQLQKIARNALSESNDTSPLSGNTPASEERHP